MQREGAMEHQRLDKGAPGCGATQAVGCGAASVRRGVCIDARKAGSDCEDEIAYGKDATRPGRTGAAR